MVNSIKILALSFSMIIAGVALAQDECSNAVNMPFDNYSTCGQMTLQTINLGSGTHSSTTPAPTCGSFGATTRDLWYTMVVPTGVNTLAFHAFNSSNTVPFPNASAPAMAIYRGTNCNSLILLDCFESTGGFFQNGEIRFEEISGLVPGETLYVRVWDESNLNQNIFIAASVLTDFPEDDCETPVPLSSGGCNILSTGGDIAAPEDCGWNTTDNSIFYSFTVNPGDPQPYTITAENGECWANPGGLGEDPEIQFAVYSWNGTNCNGIGGSPISDPPNNSGTYWGCANGTGTVTFSENLPPGDYILAMDGFSMLQGNSLCIYGFSAPNIDQNLTVSFSSTNAVCGEGGSAAITVIESCTGNPTFNWSGGLGNTSSVTDIPAGNYSVTVSDGAACSDTVINFTITDGGNISASISVTGDPCAGPFDATATVTGALPADCTFAWNTTPVQNTQTATNLTAGNYTVTVTYGTCQETASTTISVGGITVSIDLSGNVCQGPVTATANAAGVDPATCTYAWNTTPAQNTQAINITTQGTYTVTVTSAGCTGTASTNIVFHNLVFHVDYIPEICAGTATSAVVVVTEGIPPYTYLWGPGGSNGSNININTTGNYSVTVTDNTGCTATESFDVTVHPGIILNTDVYDISCFGMQDGAIATNASGGTPPFTYEWTIPPVTDSIGGLAAGTYAVTVTDQNACTAFVDGIQISEPNPINFNIGTPASICSGDNTPLTVTVFGGTQPYTYHWDDLPTLNAANRIVSPTATTTYSVSITDAHGCTTTSKTVTITVSPEISLAIQTTNANCFNSCDGRAELNITGGVDPFLIDWESPNNPINTGLCAGDYSVTVTDNFGCKDSLTYQITQPDTLWSQTHSYSTNCFGSADGMAVVAAFGGVPIDTINSQLVYNYLWSNGDTNDTIIAASGTYYVTVTDDHGCTTRNQIFIDQPPAVYVTPIFSTWICIGQSVNYHAYATGGDGFYTFTWTGSDGTHYFGENITVNPVLTTSYTLQVLDNHQCVGNVQTVTVNVHPPLSILNVEVTPDSICPGEPVSVELDIVGGNGGPYSVYYSYTQIVNNPHVFSPAHSGYLAYLVTDMCGTPAVTDSVFVTVHPLPLNAFFADVPRACPPATVNFTEDSPDVGQSYLWDFGDGGFSVAKNPSHTYTLSGTYDVSLTVWSEWGCELTATNTNMIRIWPKPRAEFIATPEVMSILDPQVVFTNISDDANLFFWYFGDGETSLWTDVDPAHIYPAPGEYNIVMIARNSYECMDTAMKRIHIYDEVTFYAPTAFSPNGDGINDLFYVTGHGINPNDFVMYVYDRWGNILFETEKFYPEQPYRMAWDGSDQGSVMKGDKILTNGVYKWYCKFTDINNNPHEESGLIYLVR